MVYLIIIIIFILIAITTILILFSYSDKKCPKCKKGWALCCIDKIEEKREPCSKKVKKQIKDKQGNTLGQTTETVYGTRYYYNYVYKCKYCGEKVKKHKTEDKY